MGHLCIDVQVSDLGANQGITSPLSEHAAASIISFRAVNLWSSWKQSHRHPTLFFRGLQPHVGRVYLTQIVSSAETPTFLVQVLARREALGSRSSKPYLNPGDNPVSETRVSSRETHQTDGIQISGFHQRYAKVAGVTSYRTAMESAGRIRVLQSSHTRVPPSFHNHHYPPTPSPDLGMTQLG